MSDEMSELEAILGGRLERSDARVVPGTDGVSTRGAIYFSDDGKTNARSQFRHLTCFAEPSSATFGGISEGGCDVLPPGGPLFHATIYHGDLRGWKKDIEVGAKGLGLLLAEVQGGFFTISDGRSIPLSECDIRFT